eukprot:gene12504-biopygen7314
MQHSGYILRPLGSFPAVALPWRCRGAAVAGTDALRVSSKGTYRTSVCPPPLPIRCFCGSMPPAACPKRVDVQWRIWLPIWGETGSSANANAEHLSFSGLPQVFLVSLPGFRALARISSSSSPDLCSGRAVFPGPRPCRFAFRLSAVRRRNCDVEDCRQGRRLWQMWKECRGMVRHLEWKMTAGPCRPGLAAQSIGQGGGESGRASDGREPDGNCRRLGPRGFPRLPPVRIWVCLFPPGLLQLSPRFRPCKFMPIRDCTLPTSVVSAVPQAEGSEVYRLSPECD